MKVLNFGSCNIDYVYQMEHFIRPGETAPCTALSAGCGGKGLNQSIALAKPCAQRMWISHILYRTFCWHYWHIWNRQPDILP